MNKTTFFTKLIYIFAVALFLAACDSQPQKLPILGNREAVTKTVNGKEITDTLYHQIPDFEFVNQDSVKVTQKNFEGKIYIADFFFTTCPTICPKMKTQMLRIYEKYKDNSKVGILSHSIDPRHDTPAVLREFMNNLGIKSKMWQMVTGDKAKIYEIGQKSYMVSATDDPTQPGGIVHSGAFILVDKNRHIRGIYDGTEPTKVDKLMIDMEILLNEL
jgi:protein SCO1/2